MLQRIEHLWHPPRDGLIGCLLSMIELHHFFRFDIASPWDFFIMTQKVSSILKFSI